VTLDERKTGIDEKKAGIDATFTGLDEKKTGHLHKYQQASLQL